MDGEVADVDVHIVNDGVGARAPTIELPDIPQAIAKQMLEHLGTDAIATHFYQHHTDRELCKVKRLQDGKLGAFHINREKIKTRKRYEKVVKLHPKFEPES